MLIQPEERTINLAKEGATAVIRELTPADYLIVSEVLGDKKDDPIVYENALIAMSIVRISVPNPNNPDKPVITEFKVSAVNSLSELMKRQAMPVKDWSKIVIASADLNNPNPEQLGK